MKKNACTIRLYAAYGFYRNTLKMTKTRQIIITSTE